MWGYAEEGAFIVQKMGVDQGCLLCKCQEVLCGNWSGGFNFVGILCLFCFLSYVAVSMI